MNEYIIVSFIEEPPQRFDRSVWPLHVTLLGTFQTDLNLDETVQLLREVCIGTDSLVLTGKSKEMFGRNDDIPVTELHKTPELQQLHTKLLAAFLEQATLKSPVFFGNNYRPHVAKQLSGTIEPSQKVLIDSLSLVKLISDKGEIMETVRF